MVDSGVTVLLVNPPSASGELVIREGRCEQSGGLWTTVWPPLTLATIGAFLENAGHTVDILDCPVRKIDDDTFLATVERFQPDMVVLNVSTPTLEHDLSFPALIKRRFPACRTAALGTHVSCLAEETLNACPELDFIVIGEPELTVVDLAGTCRSGSSPTDVPGIAYRQNGKVLRSAPRPFIADLDRLPVPAWHLLNLDDYRLPLYHRPFLMVSSGRGCPFSCSFCTAQTYYGEKLRLRSPEAVAREMFTVQDKYGVSDFLFWTETFTVNREQVRKLCDLLIQSGRNLRWTCNSRVDVVDIETMKRMKAAGCWMVSFGIESATQCVLDSAGKNVKVEDVRQAVKLAKTAGLSVTGHFILGLPGETEASLRATSRFARKLELDYAQFYCAVPFPGSRLYEEARKKKWIVRNDWRFFDQTVSNLSLPGLSPDAVTRARDHAIRSFYLHPRRIFKTLTGVRSWRELTSLYKMFIGFVRSMR